MSIFMLTTRFNKFKKRKELFDLLLHLVILFMIQLNTFLNLDT